MDKYIEELSLRTLVGGLATGFLIYLIKTQTTYRDDSLFIIFGSSLFGNAVSDILT